MSADINEEIITAVAGSGQHGATFATIPYDREVGAVLVTMDELKDFKSSSVEEFGQFAVGEFFAAGGFWLSLERAITVQAFWTDALFWICVILCGAGITVGYFGLRQLRRRKDRIDRIVESARMRAKYS